MLWLAEHVSQCGKEQMGLQDWTTDSDKFEPEDGGLTRLSFPCCACKHQSKTDADEPCRSCGHNVNAVIDTANAERQRPDGARRTP